MPDYRFYKIGDDGHVAGPPENIELPNDGAAMQEAKKLINGQDVEVWQGARLVAYLVPDQG
jgi:hypothetical protein